MASDYDIGYEEGYEDGKKFKDSEIASLEKSLKYAKADLARAKEESAYYRAFWYRPNSAKYSVP